MSELHAVCEYTMYYARNVKLYFPFTFWKPQTSISKTLMSIFLFVIELYGSPEGQERFLFIYLFIYWCTFFKLFFHVWHRVIFCFHSFHVSSRVKKKKFHTRKTHFFTQLDTWKKKFDHEREKKVSFHSAHGQKCFNMEKKNLWKEKCFTLDMEENEFYLWRRHFFTQIDAWKKMFHPWKRTFLNLKNEMGFLGLEVFFFVPTNF